MSGSLDILAGARVQGNYALSGTTLSYCPASFPPVTTLQFSASGDAIVFGSRVHSAELGGFGITRQAAGNPTTGSMAAVVVSSGKVSLSTLLIGAQSGVENTYGVDVEGGDVTLTGSSVEAGQGTASAVGVLVNGGTVNVRNNCTLDGTGTCPSSCTAANALGIRGRASATGGTAAASAESSAVYARAGSVLVVANNLCGGGNGASAGKDGSLATLRCDSGACATIAANAIAATNGNVKQLATVSLADGGGLVDGNVILGGCASDYAAAVLLSNAPARLQNNLIIGATCGGGASTFYGVRAILGSGAGEPDLNSNDIEPAGGQGDCSSIGVSIERAAGDDVAATILRNNIISTGVCRKRFAVRELSNASARIVENNDFYPSATSTTADTMVLYRRGSTDPVIDAVTEVQVNSLLAGAANNLASDPSYVMYPVDLRLSSGSPCVDHGTFVGAPANDFAGTPRPQGVGFDIGALERVGR